MWPLGSSETTIVLRPLTHRWHRLLSPVPQCGWLNLGKTSAVGGSALWRPGTAGPACTWWEWSCGPCGRIPRAGRWAGSGAIPRLGVAASCARYPCCSPLRHQRRKCLENTSKTHPAHDCTGPQDNWAVFRPEGGHSRLVPEHSTAPLAPVPAVPSGTQAALREVAGLHLSLCGGRDAQEGGHVRVRGR